MMRRTEYLLGVIATIALVGAAWGRGELRLGGAEGNAWEALAARGQVSYLLLDAEGNVTRTLPVRFVTEETSEKFTTAGVDTLMDFTGNGLQPVRIDSNDNLSLSIAETSGNFYTATIYGGGHLENDSAPLKLLIDGDPESAMLVRVPEPPRLAGINHPGVVENNVLNLGAEFPINRIRFYPRAGYEENYLAWYEVAVADRNAPFWNHNHDRSERGKRWYMVIDAALGSTNDPALDILARNSESLDVEVDLRFPVRDLKWIAVRALDPERDWEIAELEIYGEGYVTRTVYRSWIMDFGQPIAWSKIRWEGEVPEGTRLQLRTRSGNTPQPHIYRHLGPSGTLETSTLANYRSQLSSRRWDDVKLDYDLDNWSFWSAPYEFEAGARQDDIPADLWSDGTAVLSPSPARYFQVDVVMFAKRDVAPRLDNLSLLFSEQPFAHEVVGEIWPIVTRSFEPETFTYVVRPILTNDDGGFDRLEIFTAQRVRSVSSVLVDGEEVSERFPPEIADDRVVVSFDRIVGAADTEKRIEVVFETTVLRFGTEFKSWVYDSAEPELKQQVAAGNATFRFGGNVVSVRTPMGGDLINRVRPIPPTFTPNGDGRNDEVRFAYELRDLETSRRLELAVFDLSGRLVRQLLSAGRSSGSFEIPWDGRDEGGAVVPPGVYLYRLEWDTDRGSEVAGGTIAVAY